MGAGLRHREECEQRQEEGQEEEKWRVGHRLRRDGALPPGPVAERGVAAGDAHWVQPPGAELLVARWGDEASPGGGTRLPIMYSCTQRKCGTVIGQPSSFDMLDVLQNITWLKRIVFHLSPAVIRLLGLKISTFKSIVFCNAAAFFIALLDYGSIDFLSALINWCLSVWYMLLQFVCLYEGEKKLIFCSAITFYCTPEPLTPLSSDVFPSGVYLLCVSMVCYSWCFIIYVAFLLCYLSCVFLFFCWWNSPLLDKKKSFD